MNGETKRRLKAVMDAAVQEKTIAGASLLVVRDGKEQFFNACGMADMAAKKPITRDTIFRMYSMTKPITGAAAMILMERGMIDLCDPVSAYLPGFQGSQVVSGEKTVPANQEVRIKHLLDMTSGLTYESDGDAPSNDCAAVFKDIVDNLYGASPVSTVEAANRFGGCRLAFHPGEHCRYGTSADVLGAVIEVAAGKTFGEFLQEEIFLPLDMKDTGFTVEASKRERLSKVYEQTESGLQEYTGNHLGIINKMDRRPVFESGGAGLVSTIDDYMKFAQMLLMGGSYQGKQILSPKTVRYFTTGQLQPCQQEDFVWQGLEGFSYANLMRVMKQPEIAWINASLGEYGWDGWLGTYFANDPLQKQTILIMLQRKDSGTIAMERKIRNIIASDLC